jgi:hypothetical protein
MDASSTIDTRGGKNTLESISTLGGEPHVVVESSIPYNVTSANVAISPDGRQIGYLEEKPSGGQIDDYIYW